MSTLIKNSKKFFIVFVLAVLVILFLFAAFYFSSGLTYKASLNLISRGKYSEAVRLTTLWTKIIPANPHFYSLRGYARFYTGDYNGAVADYDKAYELQHDEYKSMNFDNKIYIKYFLKEYDSALNDFNQAIEKAQYGEKNSLLWDKAQFLYNIGKYNDALNIYNDLISKSANDKVYLMEARLYYERAQVYFSLGNNSKANKDIEISQKLDLDTEYQNAIPEPTFLIEEI